MAATARRRSPAFVGILSAGLLLAACGDTDASGPDVDRDAAASVPTSTPAPGPPPELEPIWSRPTNIWGPGVTSGTWWAVSLDDQGGPGPMSAPTARGLQTGDALTGRVRDVAPRAGGGASGVVCRLTGLPPEPTTGDGRFLVGTWNGADYCDLELLVVTSEGSRWLPAPPGAGQVPSPERGDPMIGTWDGVTVTLTGGGVQGTDASGTTVWTGPELRHRDSPIWLFDWTETVVASPSGPLLVTYDFSDVGDHDPVPDVGEQPDATLTVLDPRTGVPGEVLGTVADSDFQWLVGDVAIFVRGADYTSSYEGYELPQPAS